MNNSRQATAQEVHDHHVYSNTWIWRDLKSLAVGFQVWPMPFEWVIWEYQCDEDRYGGQRSVQIGPLLFCLTYNSVGRNVNADKERSE